MSIAEWALITEVLSDDTGLFASLLFKDRCPASLGAHCP